MKDVLYLLGYLYLVVGFFGVLVSANIIFVFATIVGLACMLYVVSKDPNRD